MVYILNDESTYNVLPENKYYSNSGNTMAFKRGLFLFDTNNKSKNFYVNSDMHQVEFDGLRFNYTDDKVFGSYEQANIVFHKLKLIEMKTNGYNYFMNKSYSLWLAKSEKLIDEFPEYSI